MAYDSRSPPIIPDGQVSRVRFETLAFFRRPSQRLERFNRWSVYTRAIAVCPQPRLLSRRDVTPVLSSRPPYGQEAAKCPEPLCPTWVLPPLGRCECHLLRGRYPSVIAPRAHVPLPLGSLLLRHLASLEESWQVVRSPCCPRELPDVISENLSLDAASPTPAVYRVLSPVSSTVSSAFPTRKVGRLSASVLRITTSRRPLFRGYRYFVMFRPPSLLAPQIVPTAAHTTARQPGLLRPGLSCFVTSARTGYASRPNTGN